MSWMDDMLASSMCGCGDGWMARSVEIEMTGFLQDQKKGGKRKATMRMCMPGKLHIMLFRYTVCTAYSIYHSTNANTDPHETPLVIYEGYFLTDCLIF